MTHLLFQYLESQGLVSFLFNRVLTLFCSCLFPEHSVASLSVCPRILKHSSILFTLFFSLLHWDPHNQLDHVRGHFSLCSSSLNGSLVIVSKKLTPLLFSGVVCLTGEAVMN